MPVVVGLELAREPLLRQDPVADRPAHEPVDVLELALQRADGVERVHLRGLVGKRVSSCEKILTLPISRAASSLLFSLFSVMSRTL